VAHTPISRKTVTELAAEAVREKILSGRYAEGAPLRQDAIAVELGVSRIPVREALRQLEAEGLVAFQPHCGAVVSSLSLEEIEELFELRALVEGDLIRRAVPRLTPDDLRRAGEILDAYEAAFSAGATAEWGTLNWRFHSTLLSAARRPLSMGVALTLHTQSERYTRLQLVLTRGEVRASGEHREILAAAIARDAERTARLLATHIIRAGQSLIEFLRVHRARGAAPSRASVA
jgi:DNA-binding GntR family transcriptional regulator